jgi:hypothetical protein
MIYKQGYILLKSEDKINKLHFIESGILELYTSFEGNEFVLDRLYMVQVSK